MRRTRSGHVAAVSLVLLAAAGCASMDSAPFEAFEVAARRVAKGSEAAFRLDELIWIAIGVARPGPSG